MPDMPRAGALQILNVMDRGRRTLDAVMEAHISSDTPKRDAALIHALVYGVLRWRGRLDHLISRFSKTPMKRIHPQILNVLRMGLFQILFMDKIPVSAAVNTSVDLAGTTKAGKWTSGFVNGILRNAARRHETIPFPDPHKMPAAYLAAEKSYPEWMTERWLRRLGMENAANLCDAMNTLPPLTLRVNTLKMERDSLIRAISGEGRTVTPTPFSPEGVRTKDLRMPVAEIPGYAEGWFQVQDEAAQLVSHLAGPRPGRRILDACAGLGGKTGHLAQLMNNEGTLLAGDREPRKLERLETEMARLGISVVQTKEMDLNRPVSSDRYGLFDRILVDAHCSGLGVLRRHPDGKWNTPLKQIQECGRRQIRFLHHASALVQKNGLLVYAVCTTEPEETSEVVNAFLNRHSDFHLETRHPGLPEPARTLLRQEGRLMTFPHLHDMDGFFAAVFRRVS